jgi:signal transduction histidine kinase
MLTFKRWCAVVTAWLAIGAFAAGQIYVARRARGEHTPLAPLALMELPVWLVWAAATPFIVLLGQRHRLDRGLSTSWLIHGVGAVVTGAAYAAFRTAWYQTFNPYPLTAGTWIDWYWITFRQVFILGFVIYWAVVGVYHAVFNYDRFRERSLHAEQVGAQLALARLDALTTQLQPHFLFNTLNSVSALVGDQPQEARRMIARLSSLLRATLDAGALDEMPLRRELELVDAYLAIEQMRFGDRLRVERRIAPGVEHALAPGLLLQPIVENAIRHGFAHREAPGHLMIRASREGDELVLEVRDDGEGMAPGSREGIGLGNTRRRLAELYGDDARLTLAAGATGGVDVSIRLPFRAAAGSAERNGSGS